MSYWGYPKYVTVAAKKAKAAKKLKELSKKNPDMKPVVVEGSTIARTWWGKAWTVNLEQYADYSNRIGRGRSYVRHGAVLDLRIEAGEVKALVQGSASKPYSVSVKIQTLRKRPGTGSKPRVKAHWSLFMSCWPENSRRPWARYSYAKTLECFLPHVRSNSPVHVLTGPICANMWLPRFTE